MQCAWDGLVYCKDCWAESWKAAGCPVDEPWTEQHGFHYHQVCEKCGTVGTVTKVTGLCAKCWSEQNIQETNALAEKFIAALNNATFEGIPIKKTDGIPGATGKHKQTAVVHAVSSSAHADQFDELTAKGWKLDMVLGLYYKP